MQGMKTWKRYIENQSGTDYGSGLPSDGRQRTRGNCAVLRAGVSTWPAFSSPTDLHEKQNGLERKDTHGYLCSMSAEWLYE